MNLYMATLYPEQHARKYSVTRLQNYTVLTWGDTPQLFGVTPYKNFVMTRDRNPEQFGDTPS